MSARLSFVAVVLLGLATTASAGLSRSVMVPDYAPCPGSGNCFPAKLASTYTFESITLFSSPKAYTAPGKLALMLAVKGLKDAGGNLVTGRLTVRVQSRVTILQGIGTIGETSPLAETVYVVDVKNGNARARFNTPDETPEKGLRVNTF